MKLTIGFSPCPNDTYIFEALVNQRFDLQGIEYEVILADVEELNKMAQSAQLDITKISYGAVPTLCPDYQILNSGSALGHGNGPLLISKEPIDIQDIEGLKIAIPGANTTANMLLNYFFPKAQNKHEVLFSDIEKEVINGNFDAGLIIHENRFTYQDRGLHKIIDLGAYWEEKTQLPIPLGGIAIKRNIDQRIQHQVDQHIFQSLSIANKDVRPALPYIREHAQAMSEEVMLKHIELYVNEFSLSLGKQGKLAIENLYKHTINKTSFEQLFV